MSCLRSRFLTRRTTASRARSIIRLDTYHSGSRSFWCGAVGWQKSSGMAASPLSAGEHFDDVNDPHDGEHYSRPAEQRSAHVHVVVGHMYESVQQAEHDEDPGQHHEYDAGLMGQIGENRQHIE